MFSDDDKSVLRTAISDAERDLSAIAKFHVLLVHIGATSSKYFLIKQYYAMRMCGIAYQLLPDVKLRLVTVQARVKHSPPITAYTRTQAPCCDVTLHWQPIRDTVCRYYRNCSHGNDRRDRMLDGMRRH